MGNTLQTLRTPSATRWAKHNAPSQHHVPIAHPTSSSLLRFDHKHHSDLPRHPYFAAHKRNSCRRHCRAAALAPSHSKCHFWIYLMSTFKSWDSFYKHQHLIKIFFEENKFVDESGCLFHNDRELLSLVRPHSAPTIKLQHPHKPPPLYYTCKLKMQKLTHISPFLVFPLKTSSQNG